MSRNQALQTFNQELHISHNQIFTYLNCQPEIQIPVH